MHFVVTGALGHIGSRLIQAMSQMPSDIRVTLLDDMSSQPCCPVSDLLLDKRHEFREEDVTTADLANIFGGADVVIHLAARSNAEESFARREEFEQINFLGTRKVAEACARTGAALIFASTTSVYQTEAASVDEDCVAAELRPQTPYAATKLRAEQLLQALAHREGLRHVVCRFGTIFGPSPGMKFHTAVSKFCRQAVNREPITVWKTALRQQRPYLELGDAVNAMLFLAKQGPFGGETFNVLSLNASVEAILEEVSAFVPGLTVEYVSSPAMNEQSFRVDCSRLARRGFLATGSLRQGIAETITALRAGETPSALCAEPAL